MKLLILSFCVLVLVALANTKPCSGPRCKRMSWNPYGFYDNDDTSTSSEDTNVQKNNSYGHRIGGTTNENTRNPKNRDHRRGYDYNNPETNDGDTNEEENNGPYYGIGGKTNENGPNRMKYRYRDHKDGDTETNDGDTNEEENNGPYGIGGKTNENGPNRWSDCPNCYAYGFGHSHYNENTINIEKKNLE